MPSLSHSMWDLVPWPGIEARLPELRGWILSHWTTREDPWITNSEVYFFWRFCSCWFSHIYCHNKTMQLFLSQTLGTSMVNRKLQLSSHGFSWKGRYGLKWILAQLVKKSACNVGYLAPITGLGRSLREGNSYLLQYSGLDNPLDCLAHGVANSQTWMSNFHLLIWCVTLICEYCRILAFLG